MRLVEFYKTVIKIKAHIYHITLIYLKIAFSGMKPSRSVLRKVIMDVIA